jgi:hypothetical protein
MAYQQDPMMAPFQPQPMNWLPTPQQDNLQGATQSLLSTFAPALKDRMRPKPKVGDSPIPTMGMPGMGSTGGPGGLAA